SPLPANMEASRAAGDGLHPRPSAPGGTHTGGCLRGVWALGAGRGKAAPPQPPSLGRPHGLGVACVGLVFGSESPARDSGGALERGSTVLRAADAHLHRVRRMPSRPQRQAVGGVLRLRFAKTWPTQAPSKQSGPMRVPSGFDGRGCLSPLVACDAEISSLWWAKCRQSRFWVRLLVARCLRTWRRQGRRRTACTPDRRLPVAPTQGGCGRRRSSVARDPEISSTWPGEVSAIPACKAPARELGSPSPAKVEASHRQVGPVPRFFAPRFPTRASSRIFVPTGACLGVLAAVRLPRRSNASWDGGRWLVCSGICVRNGRRQHPPQAASVVGPSALLPWPRSVSCAAYPSRRHSIVPNVPFSPCAAPLGAAARGGPQGARCVPRPAHGRTCPGRWPIASSPDLSDAEHTVGTRPRPLFAPKASVRRFVRTTPATVLGSSHAGGGVGEECYLVDPASSHMLVSKIKPCMCNYSLFDGTCYSDNRSNSRANTCNKPRLLEGMHLLDKRSTRAPPVAAMIHDNSTDRTALVPATHHSNFCLSTFDGRIVAYYGGDG
ncbi:UNVERIFIED_CONTAM: hypothetical protein Sindi_3112100, partial [Sesamum indicum]